MSKLTVAHWVHAHGRDSIQEICDMLDRGITQREIAKIYKVDPGQLSRLIDSTVETRHAVKTFVIEYLEQLSEIDHARLDRIRASRAEIIRVDFAHGRAKDSKASEDKG